MSFCETLAKFLCMKSAYEMHTGHSNCVKLKQDTLSMQEKKQQQCSLWGKLTTHKWKKIIEYNDPFKTSTKTTDYLIEKVQIRK